MTTKYWTKNICGGETHTTSLKSAVKNAEHHFSDGYVYSKKGKRPVCNGELESIVQRIIFDILKT